MRVHEHRFQSESHALTFSRLNTVRGRVLETSLWKLSTGFEPSFLLDIGNRLAGPKVLTFPTLRAPHTLGRPPQGPCPPAGPGSGPAPRPIAPAVVASSKSNWTVHAGQSPHARVRLGLRARIHPGIKQCAAWRRVEGPARVLRGTRSPLSARVLTNWTYRTPPVLMFVEEGGSVTRWAASAARKGKQQVRAGSFSDTRCRRWRFCIHLRLCWLRHAKLREY